MKLSNKFWRGLLISLTVVLIGLAGLTPSSVGAQDNKVPAAPTLNMDQTQRVGTDTMGYVTIPADFSQTKDEEKYKEWANSDGSITVILRSLDPHQPVADAPDNSDVYLYTMGYLGEEMGKRNAGYVAVDRLKADDPKAGMTLTATILLEMEGKKVPTLMNYNVNPASTGAKLLLIRVYNFDNNSIDKLVPTLTKTWSDTK